MRASRFNWSYPVWVLFFSVFLSTQKYHLSRSPNLFHWRTKYFVIIIIDTHHERYQNHRKIKSSKGRGGELNSSAVPVQYSPHANLWSGVASECYGVEVCLMGHCILFSSFQKLTPCKKILILEICFIQLQKIIERQWAKLIQKPGKRSRLHCRVQSHSQ